MQHALQIQPVIHLSHISSPRFSHAPHLPNWVTSLPSSKKPLLERGVFSGPAKDLFQICFSRGEFRERLSWQTDTQENLPLGEGEGVKFLNSHFSAENVERNIEEFGWGAAKDAGMQVPEGTGAECASPGQNPWDSSCKGKSKLCTRGYLPVHPGRRGQVVESKGRQPQADGGIPLHKD